MVALFQNSTTYKSNSGMSDHDIMTANNELKRKKDKLRYTIGVSVCVVWLLFRIITTGGMGYAGFLIQTFIGILIGFVPAEFIVRKTYGNNPGIGVGVTSSKVFKYTFTDEKILVTSDFDTINIPYGEIERVTHNPYSYFVYYRGSRYQMDKAGFSVDSKEFEKLMLSYGQTVGIEYEN